MDSSPTLQDFVLNLIYDPTARSAFQLDGENRAVDKYFGNHNLIFYLAII